MPDLGLINISDGNSKLGAIPNISLVPGRDCGNCSHCVKDCYAVKFWRIYPAVRNAWEKNSTAAKDQKSFFRAIERYIKSRRPEYFRFHVAGDIKNQRYLDNMKLLASRYPQTRFLTFTKMHHLDFRNLPANLAIVASMWPGLELPEGTVRQLPKAWMQDGTDSRVPANAIPCPGRCDPCGTC